MKPSTIPAAAVLCALPAMCQQAPPASNTVPLYRVTVVERNVQAVNYQYRAGPTKIDFRGTVLLSNAKGEAVVDSRRGRTEIDAKFEHLVAPTRFGREYLTYVLWAISPDGAPHNLGELVPDASDHAKIRVTTALQAFGLIVTAEPYSAVRQPSDVVVLENEIRPDTVGQAQPIQAKYELMPRGHYTLDLQQTAAPANAPKVSMAEYEALTEVYQAQNAVNIARTAGADTYAPGTFGQAERLLKEAQRLEAGKFDRSLVVQNARAAAQTAEDARVIAERRKQDEKVTQAQKEAAAAQEAKARAEAEAQRAQAQARAAEVRAESERAARERAETDAAAAANRAGQGTAHRMESEASRNIVIQPTGQSQGRMRLLEQLNGIAVTRDTPRGLVVTLRDTDFSGTGLGTAAYQQVARIANVLAATPGLHVEVDGNTDSAATSAYSEQRSAAVRDALVRGGLTPAAVAARNFGDTRPLVSNASEAGRLENRRVEIVISGDPIGTLPFWDRTYSVAPR